MLTSPTLTLAAVSFLLPPLALAAGLYPKDSPVLQVDGRSYRNLLEKSNGTSIIEFYAPWCGHCQSTSVHVSLASRSGLTYVADLKPAYEKAAKSLTGLAKVAAVNCDDEENKPFCGSTCLDQPRVRKTVLG